MVPKKSVMDMMSFTAIVSVETNREKGGKSKKEPQKLGSKSGKKKQKTQSRLGKKVRNIRTQLNMSQPSFAKWISVEIGEEISSLMVCRMENYGARDACSSIKPSPAVIKIVMSIKKTEEVEDNLRRYDSMSLMEQPGDTFVEKLLNAYRANDMLPPDLKDLKDEEILRELGIEDTDATEEESVK